MYIINKQPTRITESGASDEKNGDHGMLAEHFD
jgi:hypothetical protein